MNMTTIRSDRYQQDEVLSAVHAAGSVLLLCHVSPDGDTLGSALALKRRLERMGKKAQIMVDGTIPAMLGFLPQADTVLTAKDAAQPYDLAIGVDVSSLDRLGACQALFESALKSAVIDHHETDPGYGQVNMIDGDAPATAILIYRLFQEMDMPIDREEAVCLYTALSTDTGNFIYDSTNAESFAMMEALMTAGLPLTECSRRLFRTKEEAFVRLLAQVLPTLRVVENGRAAGLTLTLEGMRQAGANGGHCDGIVDYAIDLRGVGMAYFIREMEDGRVKASLRALEPYRVDQLAASLGGGGHRLAAGVTLEMKLDEAVQTIERMLKEVLG